MKQYKIGEKVRLCLVADAPSPISEPIRAAEQVAEKARFIIPENAMQEYCIAFFLDSRHRIIKHSVISIGGLNSASVDGRVIFATALLEGSVTIILVHNHPSGDPTPSPEDILLTKMLATIGDFHSITLLDHVILGSEGSFVSMAKKNLVQPVKWGDWGDVGDVGTIGRQSSEMKPYVKPIHYTDQELLEAEIADIETDIRCAMEIIHSESESEERKAESREYVKSLTKKLEGMKK